MAKFNVSYEHRLNGTWGKQHGEKTINAENVLRFNASVIVYSKQNNYIGLD